MEALEIFIHAWGSFESLETFDSLSGNEHCAEPVKKG